MIQIPFKPLPPTPYLILTALLVVLGSMFFVKNHFQPKGKVCYVTGGSTGLGKALALDLVRRGASVTIVARGQKALDDTLSELQAIAGPSQRIYTISADLTSAKSSEEAFEEACQQHGRVPDYAFLCAGMSKPKYFIDASSDDLKDGMDGTYWVQAYTAHAVCKKMISTRTKGSIIFVSSFLGYTSFAGYSTYSPGKYALRGLADTLRSEMLLHDIKIHIFMPAGIDTPGYITEQEHKPAITRIIEEGDKIISPGECAGHLIRGLEGGHYQPTSYFVTDLMRMQSRGAVPGNNIILDAIWWLISGIGVPIWRLFADHTVRGHKSVVEADLTKRGYYKTA